MSTLIEAADWLRPYDESGTMVTPGRGRRYRWIPASVPALFADLAAMRPDVDAVIDLGRQPGADDSAVGTARRLVTGARLSYAQMWERGQRVAGGLAARGTRPGDRIAIRLPNGLDWCLSFLGALTAGAVAVPVNTRLTDAEAGLVVDDCGASIAIGPGDTLPDGPPLVRECDPDALDALFYTSGTTGRPKGAMLTHRAMLSAAESARRALELSALPERDLRNLVPAPLFHVMGSLVQWLPTCLAAGTTVLMPAFDPGEWLRAIEAERISVLTAVPAMYWLAMRHPAFAQTDLGSVRRVGYGAAPAPPAQVSALLKAFPRANLCPGYGLTESCGIVSGLPHDYALSHADASPATCWPTSRSRSTSPFVPSRCRGTPAVRSSSPGSATRPLGQPPLVTPLSPRPRLGRGRRDEPGRVRRPDAGGPVGRRRAGVRAGAAAFTAGRRPVFY